MCNLQLAATACFLSSASRFVQSPSRCPILCLYTPAQLETRAETDNRCGMLVNLSASRLRIGKTGDEAWLNTNKFPEPVCNYAGPRIGQKTHRLRTVPSLPLSLGSGESSMDNAVRN